LRLPALFWSRLGDEYQIRALSSQGPLIGIRKGKKWLCL
jgi:hypothetical protein